MSEPEFHPLVKQLLDGDITLADLPSELRAEGDEALRLLAAVDRSPVQLPAVSRRVMRAVASRPARSVWRVGGEPRAPRPPGPPPAPPPRPSPPPRLLLLPPTP